MKKNICQKMLSVILAVIMVAPTVCFTSSAVATVDPYVKAAVDAGIFLEEVDPDTELDCGFFVPVLARCYKGNRGKEFTFEEAKERLCWDGLMYGADSADEKVDRLYCALIVGDIWIYTGNEKHFTINSYELNCKDSSKIFEDEHAMLSALIQIGAFSLSSDGYFYPDKIATVGDLAQAVCVTMRLEVDLSGYQESASKEETKSNNLFSDVPEDHWAYFYIQQCCERNILNGYPVTDGNSLPEFKPDGNVKLGELLKMACLMIWPNYHYRVKDGDTHWAQPYQRSINLITSFFTFIEPEELQRDATREEAVIIIGKMILFLNDEIDFEENDSYIEKYKDVESITRKSTIYYANNMVKWGLLEGFPDGTLGLEKTLTRAQVSKLVYIALHDYTSRW